MTAASPITLAELLSIIGNILVVVAMIISAVAVVTTVRTQVTGLKEVVVDLATRLTNHEATLFTLFGQVQRLIGHVEAANLREGRKLSED